MASFYLGLHDSDFDPEALTNPALHEKIRRMRVERALPRNRKAVARDPVDPFAQYRLGLNLFHLGKLDEAVAHLEEATRLAPENPKLRNALVVARRELDEVTSPFQ